MKNISVLYLRNCYDISINCYENEIVGLLGPNGAGKTTTIKMLCGIEKPSNGTIKLFGKEFSGSEKEIKRRIGIVPQELAIYENLTAKENLYYFGRLYGISKKQLKENVEDVLKTVGLLDAKNKLAKNFSGGMKRRLNIGCAIVSKPDLLIMDEPTVGIDPQSRNYILDFAYNYAKDNKTVIYCSHYMEEVEKICNRIYIMDLGKVISSGNINEVIDNANLDEKISITLKDISNELLEELRSLKIVKNIEVFDNNIILTINKEEDKMLVFKLISKYNLLNFSSKKPSLEDVFLALTGKKLRDEEN